MKIGKIIVLSAIFVIILLFCGAIYLSYNFKSSTNNGGVLGSVVPTCTADGFANCYKTECSRKSGYADAEGFAQIGYNPPSTASKMNGGYVIGKAVATYSCSASCSKSSCFTTIDVGAKAWQDCTEGVCPGVLSANEGEVVLATAPAAFVPSVYIYCYGYRYDAFSYQDINDWAYCWTTAGYQTDKWDVKVVECYDNTDCSSGQYCDKSGEWDTWKCRSDLCAGVSCGDSCNGNTLQTNGLCDTATGSCDYTETACTNGCDSSTLKCKDSQLPIVAIVIGASILIAGGAGFGVYKVVRSRKKR